MENIPTFFSSAAENQEEPGHFLFGDPMEQNSPKSDRECHNKELANHHSVQLALTKKKRKRVPFTILLSGHSYQIIVKTPKPFDLCLNIPSLCLSSSSQSYTLGSR